MKLQRDVLCALAALVFLCNAIAARADEKDILKAKVTSLSKQLESGTVTDKIKAAGDLGKIGPDARGAAKALGKAAVDPSAKVSQAALEALEKIWPELYQAAVILLKDKDEQFNKSDKRAEACNTIATSGDD